MSETTRISERSRCGDAGDRSREAMFAQSQLTQALVEAGRGEEAVKNSAPALAIVKD